MIELTEELVRAQRDLANISSIPSATIKEACDLLERLQELEPRVIDSDSVKPVLEILARTQPTREELSDLKSFVLKGKGKVNWQGELRAFEELAEATLKAEELAQQVDLSAQTIGAETVSKEEVAARSLDSAIDTLLRQHDEFVDALYQNPTLKDAFQGVIREAEQKLARDAANERERARRAEEAQKQQEIQSWIDELEIDGLTVGAPQGASPKSSWSYGIYQHGVYVGNVLSKPHEPITREDVQFDIFRMKSKLSD